MAKIDSITKFLVYHAEQLEAVHSHHKLDFVCLFVFNQIRFHFPKKSHTFILHFHKIHFFNRSKPFQSQIWILISFYFIHHKLSKFGLFFWNLIFRWYYLNLSLKPSWNTWFLAFSMGKSIFCCPHSIGRYFPSASWNWNHSTLGFASWFEVSTPLVRGKITTYFVGPTK